MAINNNYHPIPHVTGPTSQDPTDRRKLAYDIKEELNCLYDDIQAGIFGEEAKNGKFAQYINSIKEKFPKTTSTKKE